MEFRKNYLIIVSIILSGFYGTIVNAQNQNIMEYDGWEFLEWRMLKEDVEKILDKKGLSNESETHKDFTKFQYQNMETYLYYQYGRLNKIKQDKQFHLIEDKEAHLFFKKIKDLFTNKYGQPNHQQDDKQGGIIRLIWILKNTQIILYFDYKKKVIDELGMGSYSVKVVINPI